MNKTIVDKRLSKTEIAWLAGLFDGEGCLFFAVRKDYHTNRAVRCDIRLCMSHHATINRVAAMFARLVGDDVVGLYTEQRAEGKKRERPLRDVTIHGRKPALRILKTLLPYLFTKRLEAELAIEYLERASRVKYYRATERDRLLAQLATDLRHGRGEARAQRSLCQVIPSQAEGSEAVRTSEGVETRSVRSASNNPTQERPASSPVQLKLVGRMKR